MTVSQPDRQHYGITLAVLALGALAYALLQSLVAPALPEIQHSLGVSESAVTWVLTAYLLSASVATPLLGRLGDIHGKERVLVGVLAALALGTIVSALAASLPLMVAGRVVQGAGGAIFPLAFGIIRDEFPRERVAGGIGMDTIMRTIGGALGSQVIASILTASVVARLPAEHGFTVAFWLAATVLALGAIAAAAVRGRVAAEEHGAPAPMAHARRAG